MQEVAALAWGYLAGSLPVTFLLARRRGVDLRCAGSGNVGAANVLRTSGVTYAALAVALDVAKGALAVLVAIRTTDGPATPVATGLASVIGHIYPVWLRFRGGKGVATAAGVFLVLEPLAAALAGLVFAATVATVRYVSVGSLAGALALVMTVVVLDASPAVSAGAVVAMLMLLHSHRSNLGRLITGTERRVGERL